MTDKVKENPDKGKEKEVVILKADNGLWYCKFKNGGQVPQILGGVWTNYDELQGKINYYLNNRDKLLKEKNRQSALRSKQRRKQQTKKTEEAVNEDDSS